jgi:hypothetical protein
MTGIDAVTHRRSGQKDRRNPGGLLCGRIVDRRFREGKH